MKLPKSSFEFAKKHIENYFDSDFFSKPFEFKVIFSNWDDVLDYLVNKDISSINIECPITYAVPKHSKGYRIAHQLDPINSIVYTAMAHYIAEEVEKARIPAVEKIACSYRINVGKTGNFFENGTGYEDYYEKSMDLSKKYDYILQADITDFYNQIYLHRLQNSIEYCSPKNLKDISHEIEKFLMDINNNISKGIPVGPAASIIMAEALLIDIDQFILDKGYEYCRYVDDFRIFSNSKFDLEILTHDLTNYLYDNHRLTLEESKTKVLECNKFIENYLLDPEKLERSEVDKEIEKLNLKVINQYFEFDDDISEPINNDDKIKAQGEAFKNLMTQILEKDYFDLGLSRHILRRSKRLRSRAIVPQLLDNLDIFAPVMRDVVLYLAAVTTDKMIDLNIDRFINIVENSNAVKLPYFRYWLEYYFASFIEFTKYTKIKEFILKGNNLRNCALYAETTKSMNWVRQYKNKLFNLGSWERRALIYSSIILSQDERVHWMQNVENNTNNYLELLIAKYVKSII